MPSGHSYPLTASRVPYRRSSSNWAKIHGHQVSEVQHLWALMMSELAEVPKLSKAVAEDGPLRKLSPIAAMVDELVGTFGVVLEEARTICPRFYFVDDRRAPRINPCPR